MYDLWFQILGFVLLALSLHIIIFPVAAFRRLQNDALCGRGQKQIVYI